MEDHELEGRNIVTPLKKNNEKWVEEDGEEGRMTEQMGAPPIFSLLS